MGAPMNALFHFHSGLRYLVLLAGVLGIVLSILGLARKKSFTRQGRVVGAVFTGLLDTQVLVGLIMVFAGRFYPALIGHLVMMVAAALVAHVFLAVNRRRSEPNWLLPLYGVGGAMALIVLGLGAIGRHPFQMTPFAG